MPFLRPYLMRFIFPVRLEGCRSAGNDFGDATYYCRLMALYAAQPHARLPRHGHARFHRRTEGISSVASLFYF